MNFIIRGSEELPNVAIGICWDTGFIRPNLKTVNYLDITFNLSNATYQSFYNPKHEITYLDKESNHPTSILRQMPLFINSRLSKHSSNEKIFNASTQIYQEDLKKSGYNRVLLNPPTTDPPTHRPHSTYPPTPPTTYPPTGRHQLS